MRTARWWLGLASLALLLPGTQTVPARGQAADAKVELKTVNLDGLKDLIKQQKGNVVVVDLWADT